MKPTILKSSVDGDAGHTPTTQQILTITSAQGSSSSNSNSIDGDHTAKDMKQGVNSATKGAADMTEGLYGSTKQVPEAGKKPTSHGKSMFSKEGSTEKQFTAEGAIGGTTQSVVGPLDKQGIIGKHFNLDGSIGGAFQQMAEENEQH